MPHLTLSPWGTRTLAPQAGPVLKGEAGVEAGLSNPTDEAACPAPGPGNFPASRSLTALLPSLRDPRPPCPGAAAGPAPAQGLLVFQKHEVPAALGFWPLQTRTQSPHPWHAERPGHL